MVVGYPPLETELMTDLDSGSSRLEVVPKNTEIISALHLLVDDGSIVTQHHRYILPGYESLFEEHAHRERVFPRKWRRIQRLARWLRWIPTIRFVAVCNTTSLASARDGADIDLFVIVREETLWLTRGFLSLCAMLAFRRPGQRRGEQDAWCFSFFIDDTNLELERFMIAGADPYLRFWTRHLLPVLDDGVGAALWVRQRFAWERNPFAQRWLSWKMIPERVSFGWLKPIDRIAYRIQRRFGSATLWDRATLSGTEVVLDLHTFKTHVDDRRKDFRDAYEHLCQRLCIEA